MTETHTVLKFAELEKMLKRKSELITEISEAKELRQKER